MSGTVNSSHSSNPNHFRHRLELNYERDIVGEAPHGVYLNRAQNAYC
jgi:hypothetical protein